MPEIDIAQEVKEANAQLPLDLSQQRLPLSMALRSMALTIAQKHCGDTVVSEGNLYQQLKMDGKLGGPLTVDHVINTARVFERYLWGEFSRGLAEEAMESVLGEVEEVISKKADDIAEAGATSEPEPEPTSAPNPSEEKS